MNEPLISVIVPVYNVEKYLENCVNTLVKQTYRNIEILLIMMVLQIRVDGYVKN